MQSNREQDLLEAFAELRAIGQDIADKLNSWNDNHLDEDKVFPDVIQEMSGDSIIVAYTEIGFSEDDIVHMLDSIGFCSQEDSDDEVEDCIRNPNDVDEKMNSFLEQCIEVSNSYPYFVKAIEFNAGTHQTKDEVKIVIPSDVDIRKLPCTNARKIMFMHFLKDIREKAAHFSMIDEALCFCLKKQEFWILLRPLGKAR